jgi:hypothetical protein
MTALFEKKPKPLSSNLLTRGAVRKDSAVHVSLSSDSLVKQPGNLAVSNLPGRAEKPTKFEPPTSSRRFCPHISEELQRRAIAP